MFKAFFAYYLFLNGKNERKKGNYSKKTLNTFRQVYDYTLNINLKFSFIWVLRHFGNTISSEHCIFLCSNFEKLSKKNKTLALNFILELQEDYDASKLISLNELKKMANDSPPLAAFLKNKYPVNLSEHIQILSTFHEKQELWREEFVEYITKSKKKICIVGNSSSLLKSSLGSLIDKHDVVIRFNEYLIGDDSGNSLDVWVKSPSFKTDRNFTEQSAGWMILSGPDVRFTMLNWENIRLDLDRGSKVLTIPVYIWKELVSILEAPPSAGFLTLFWILELVEEPSMVSIAGFQIFEEANIPYHHSSPKYKTGNRHNWKKERRLLKNMCTRGINYINPDYK